MMLFGAKLEPTERNDALTLWGYVARANRHGVSVLWRSAGWPLIQVEYNPLREQPDQRWAVSVRWIDKTLVHGCGLSFYAAKRDCVRMLSERSREVGRVM